MTQTNALMPTRAAISLLTYAMKREILLLQQERKIVAGDRYQGRVLRSLERRGIVTARPVRGELVYTLAQAWRDVDFSKKPPKKIKLSPAKVPRPKDADVEAEKPRNRNERFERPDPEKPKIIRPAAVYSNVTREALINRILKTY